MKHIMWVFDILKHLSVQNNNAFIFPEKMLLNKIYTTISQYQSENENTNAFLIMNHIMDAP